jgi:Zn-dependent alcohol dehydrogenase
VTAHLVIVVDVDPARLDVASTLGATSTLDARHENVVGTVRNLVAGRVDWAIDAVAAHRRAARLSPASNRLGRPSRSGPPPAGTNVELPVTELVQGQKRVIGCLYGSASPFVDLSRVVQLYLAGRLALEHLLGAEYALKDVSAAYAALNEGAVGRSIVIPS